MKAAVLSEGVENLCNAELTTPRARAFSGPVTVMKNVLLLLLVVGIPVAAWWHWDEVKALVQPAASVEDGPVDGAPASDGAAPRLTPHPAKDARLAATTAYPALANPNSAFNKKFLALYAEAQRSEPQLLAQSDWPLKLAERTALALGGAPMPVPSVAEPVRPSGLQGSALDQRPKK